MDEFGSHVDSRAPSPVIVGTAGFEPSGVLTDGDMLFCCLVAMAKWQSLVRILEAADGRPRMDELSARPAGRSAAGSDFVWFCSHVGLVKNVFRFASTTIFDAMNFPSQGGRQSNLYWIYPQGPGTVSCTTRTS